MWISQDQPDPHPDPVLDIVFSMVRFTDPMLGNGELREACTPNGKKVQRMREFFLDRALQDQGLMLNLDGGLFFCENGDRVGNVREQDPGAIYFAA